MSKQNGSRAKELAAQFKQGARKAVDETWTKQVRLPIPSIAPDFVFEFVAKRVDLATMMYAGQLPDFFSRQILLRRQDASDVAAELQEESLEEKKASLDLMVKLALAVCAEPKLVLRDPVDDSEVDLREWPFSGNIIEALFRYAMGLSPDVPVEMTDGGETTVKAVETFPDSAQESSLPSPSDKLPEFRPFAIG